MRVKRLIDLVADDSGQDLVEYALTTGAITAGSLGAAALILLYAGNLYSNMTGNPSSGVQALWEPCAPGGCS